MNMTVKQTVGVAGEMQTLSRTNDEEIAFINALKAVDYIKEYQQALRYIAETIFDMDFDGNNGG